MMNVRVEIDDLKNFKIKIDTKATKYDEEIQKVIKKNAFAIQRNAKKNLEKNGSVDTGHLRRMVATKISRGEGEIHTSNVKYGIFVEKGTKAHIIRAKNKKYLYWEGASHPVKQVNHPGSKEKPFLIPAFEKQKPKFLEDIKRVTTLDLE